MIVKVKQINNDKKLDILDDDDDDDDNNISVLVNLQMGVAEKGATR